MRSSRSVSSATSLFTFTTQITPFKYYKHVTLSKRVFPIPPTAQLPPSTHDHHDHARLVLRRPTEPPVLTSEESPRAAKCVPLAPFDPSMCHQTVMVHSLCEHHTPVDYPCSSTRCGLRTFTYEEVEGLCLACDASPALMPSLNRELGEMTDDKGTIFMYIEPDRPEELFPAVTRPRSPQATWMLDHTEAEVTRLIESPPTLPLAYPQLNQHQGFGWDENLTTTFYTGPTTSQISPTELLLPDQPHWFPAAQPPYHQAIPYYAETAIGNIDDPFLIAQVEYQEPPMALGSIPGYAAAQPFPRPDWWWTELVTHRKSIC
jgi:molybdopterin-guanine dinucleotide biosynthesis protein A